MNKPIEIPFVIEKRRLIVYANINGINGKFIFDTGSSISLINNNLKNFEFSHFDINQYFSSYSMKQKIYKINKIYFGKKLIKAESFVGKTPSLVQKYCLKPTKSNGILGLHIFSGYLCELSFTKQKIILHENKPEGYSKKVKLRDTNEGLFINAIINGKKHDLLIDTGCQYPLMIYDCNFPKKKSLKIFSSSPNYSGFYHKIPVSFKLFNEQFSNRYVINTKKREGYGLIGIDFLKYYDILFDLKKINNNGKYLYYKKTNKNEYLHKYIFPKEISKYLVNEYWTYKDGIKIELDRNNILKKYGVNQDTLIIEINGVPIEKYDLNKLKHQYLSKDIYELTIRKGLLKRKKINFNDI